MDIPFQTAGYLDEASEQPQMRLPKRLAFKPLRHQIRHGHRDPPHQPVSVCFSERAEGAPEFQSREYVAGCWRIKRWWQRIERTRENAADPSHAFQERNVACAIA